MRVSRIINSRVELQIMANPSARSGGDQLIRNALGSTGLCLATAAALAPCHAEAADVASGDDAVVVTARRLALTVLPEKVQNTAQSINLVPQALLYEQGVNNLQDALRNVPGVTLNSGEGGSHGDTINLRGFPASDDFFIDGMRDTGFYTRDTFDDETIEIYKGPASTLFGRGSTGGVINQVSKTPSLSPLEAGTITAGSNSEVRGTVDVNVPINASSAFRINGMAQRSDVTDRDYVLNRRWGVAPSLAFGIGQPTTLTLNYVHQEQDDIPDYGIPFVAGKPAPVPRNFYYGLPRDDRFATHVDVGTLKFEHHVNDSFSVTETARLGRYWFDARETASHYDSLSPPVVPYPTAATPLDTIMIYRDRPSVEGTVTTAMSETAIHYRVRTGPLEHTLIAGFDYDQEKASLIRFTNQISAGTTVGPDKIGPTPLLNPDPLQPTSFPIHQTSIRQTPVTSTDTVAGFLFDSINIGEHWNVVGAIRLDRLHARFDQPIGVPARFEHTDVIASPRAAIVFKPTLNTRLYASYGTSFDPSAETLSLTATNQALPPQRDTTFEVGAKATVLRGRLALTAAAFDTTCSNCVTGDPTQVTQVGNIHVQGFELGAVGYLTDHVEVTAGFTHLSGSRKSTTGVAPGIVTTSSPVQNMAPNQANAWAIYEFTEGFEVGLGVNYLGRRPADIAGKAFVPSYATLDALISYEITPHLTAQLNAYNLTDDYYFTNSYFSSPAENHILPGPGRTVTATLSVKY